MFMHVCSSPPCPMSLLAVPDEQVRQRTHRTAVCTHQAFSGFGIEADTLQHLTREHLVFSCIGVP